ncbi:MAG: hypothetical protein WC323_02050 [Patescibacteria group bacterium]|jgi:hypothetical protein
MNIKTNILPNLIFILAVVVIPLCFMLVASIGRAEELLAMF